MRRARRAALLAVSLLLGLGAPGCGGGGGGDEPELAVREIVRRTAEKTGAVKSFHFKLEVKNAPTGRPGLTLSFAEGDLIVPDKLQAKVAGTLSGISLRSELIFFGDQHYLKDPFSGAWRSLDAETGPVAFFDPAKGVLTVIQGARRLEEEGSERVGGVDTYRLSGVVAARAITPILGNPPSGRLVDLELWVGKDDLILRRLRLSGPVAAGESAKIVRTVEVSRFGTSFEIEPPKTAS